jgi:hypothetical protein
MKKARLERQGSSLPQQDLSSENLNTVLEKLYRGLNGAIKMLHLAMVNGASNNIDAVFNGVSKLLDKQDMLQSAKDELIKALPILVKAQNNNGVPGLYFATKNGHSGVIEAVFTGISKLLDRQEIPQVTKNKLVEMLPDLLLPAKSDDEYYYFEDFGSFGAIEVIFTGLLRLSDRQEIPLVIKNKLVEMLPALLMRKHEQSINSMNDILPGVIEAVFSDVFELLDRPYVSQSIKDELIPVLEDLVATEVGYDRDIPMLCFAIRQGDAGIVKIVFNGLFKLLDRTDIPQAIKDEFIITLLGLIANKNDAAIPNDDAAIPDNDSISDNDSILDDFYTPGLYCAMKNNHPKVIKAVFAGLFELLDRPDIPQAIEDKLREALPVLLVSKSNNGTLGLESAMGNTAVIEVFRQTLFSSAVLPHSRKILMKFRERGNDHPAFTKLVEDLTTDLDDLDKIAPFANIRRWLHKRELG